MKRGPWNHNIQYHDLVLRSIPPGCRRALDVGCGQGVLAGKLAQHCKDVVAIDLDQPTLSCARARCSDQTRIHFAEGDVMTYPFSAGSFDFITAVATLHHLPLRPALQRLRELLMAGGVLAVIGLYRAETLRDRALAGAAFPASWMLRSLRGGYADVSAPVQNPKETLREVRDASDSLIPGAKIQQHLLFRYSLLWRKA